MTPGLPDPDGPLRIGTWMPANYNDRYYGDVTLRDALAQEHEHRRPCACRSGPGGMTSEDRAPPRHFLQA